jgi:hypothetical protein
VRKKAFEFFGAFFALRGMHLPPGLVSLWEESCWLAQSLVGNTELELQNYVVSALGGCLTSLRNPAITRAAVQQLHALWRDASATLSLRVEIAWVLTQIYEKSSQSPGLLAVMVQLLLAVWKYLPRCVDERDVAHCQEALCSLLRMTAPDLPESAATSVVAFGVQCASKKLTVEDRASLGSRGMYEKIGATQFILKSDIDQVVFGLKVVSSFGRGLYNRGAFGAVSAQLLATAIPVVEDWMMSPFQIKPILIGAWYVLHAVIHVLADDRDDVVKLYGLACEVFRRFIGAGGLEFDDVLLHNFEALLVRLPEWFDGESFLCIFEKFPDAFRTLLELKAAREESNATLGLRADNGIESILERITLWGDVVSAFIRVRPAVAVPVMQSGLEAECQRLCQVPTPVDCPFNILAAFYQVVDADTQTIIAFLECLLGCGFSNIHDCSHAFVYARALLEKYELPAEWSCEAVAKFGAWATDPDNDVPSDVLELGAAALAVLVLRNRDQLGELLPDAVAACVKCLSTPGTDAGVMAPIFELVAVFLEEGAEAMFGEDEMAAWVAYVALALGVDRMDQARAEAAERLATVLRNAPADVAERFIAEGEGCVNPEVWELFCRNVLGPAEDEEMTPIMQLLWEGPLSA